MHCIMGLGRWPNGIAPGGSLRSFWPDSFDTPRQFWPSLALADTTGSPSGDLQVEIDLEAYILISDIKAQGLGL